MPLSLSSLHLCLPIIRADRLEDFQLSEPPLWQLAVIVSLARPLAADDLAVAHRELVFGGEGVGHRVPPNSCLTPGAARPFASAVKSACEMPLSFSNSWNTAVLMFWKSFRFATVVRDSD